MATNKPPKKAGKKIIRPETVITAHPKKQPVVPPKPAKKPTVHKKPKKRLRIKKYASLRVRQSTFMLIVAAVLSIAVAITWIYVQRSVIATNRTLSDSANAAGGMYIAAKTEADLIKIIGTKTERNSEIRNFQSAPADLQKFVSADYRNFKQQCIANGKLSSDVGYEVNSVIYDSYAVVKRTCNGTDTAILKKFSGKWAVVFSGNILPPCSLINDLSIPQGASYYCADNGVTYVNPNP